MMQTEFFKLFKTFTVDKSSALKSASSLSDSDGTLVANLSSGTTYNTSSYSITTTYTNFRSYGDSIIVTLYT